jgi:hypothetical protein
MVRQTLPCVARQWLRNPEPRASQVTTPSQPAPTSPELFRPQPHLPQPCPNPTAQCTNHLVTNCLFFLHGVVYSNVVGP